MDLYLGKKKYSFLVMPLKTSQEETGGRCRAVQVQTSQGVRSLANKNLGGKTRSKPDWVCESLNFLATPSILKYFQNMET